MCPLKVFLVIQHLCVIYLCVDLFSKNHNLLIITNKRLVPTTEKCGCVTMWQST